MIQWLRDENHELKNKIQLLENELIELKQLTGAN